MKILSGSELAGYVKERQAKQVRGLRQAGKVEPKLVIIQTIDDPVTDLYTKLKQKYGADILVDVEIVKTPQTNAVDVINKLNKDASVHGIIVQLPLADKSSQKTILDSVAKEKDVDGLATDSDYDPATPLAIIWLLAGYGIELSSKKIGIVGQGVLVGAPLKKILTNGGYDVSTADINTPNLKEFLKDKEIVITATGKAGLITPDMIKQSAIVIDAGVASDSGELKGDLADDVYERDDLTISAKKGGVGPLTVATLFDNLIVAANKKRQDV